MEPTEEFWGGIGTSVSTAEGWMVVAAITLVTLVIGTLFVVAKYIYPGHKELKMRELGIREREAENDAERIKANSALAENMRGLRESNDRLAEQSAALFAGIEESKARSRSMGDDVGHIRSTTDHTAEQVEDIHRHLFREGTD